MKHGDSRQDPAPYFALVISPTRELAAQIEENFQVRLFTILHCYLS